MSQKINHSKMLALPLYRTGWFYLLLCCIGALVWIISQAGLQQLDAWNQLQLQSLNSNILASAENIEQAVQVESAIAKTNDLYSKQHWLVESFSALLACLAVVFSLYLLKLSLIKQILAYSSFVILLLFLQYLFWQQNYWLAISPALIILAICIILLAGYQNELALFRKMQSNHNELLIDSLNPLFSKNKFDKIDSYLNKAIADELLIDKVFNLALQAERFNNSAYAEKLFAWIQATGLQHEASEQKLQQYDESIDAGTLGSTMTIVPGQTMANPLNPLNQYKQFGRYQVEGILGKGAMGIVFRGVDPKINRHVAIKTLQLSETTELSQQEAKERFFREAETAGNLSHANIVTIYDVGEEAGLGYIAMDLLTGSPLSHYLKLKEQLSTKLIYQLMIQITDALHYAHQQHVVHRDIKPENLMYDADKQKVTITDFGIAHVADKSKTRTGTIIGSPYYMSPEQVLGKKVDGRSDVFSLGVTLYQLLSAELPFTGDSIASVALKISKSKHQPIKKINDKLPASASRIVNKALQKKPTDRYQTMDEFKQALVNALKRDFNLGPLS